MALCQPPAVCHYLPNCPSPSPLFIPFHPTDRPTDRKISFAAGVFPARLPFAGRPTDRSSLAAHLFLPASRPSVSAVRSLVRPLVGRSFPATLAAITITDGRLAAGLAAIAAAIATRFST